MAKKNIDKELSNIELVALGKAAGKTNGLEVGDHDFDVTLRLKGQLRKGEDYERAATASIPTLDALALFVRYCGATREAAIAALKKAMQAAYDGDKIVDADIETVTACEKAIKDAIGELPPNKVSGATTVVSLDVQKLLPTVNVDGISVIILDAATS